MRHLMLRRMEPDQVLRPPARKPSSGGRPEHCEVVVDTAAGQRSARHSGSTQRWLLLAYVLWLALVAVVGMDRPAYDDSYFFKRWGFASSTAESPTWLACSARTGCFGVRRLTVPACKNSQKGCSYPTVTTPS